ncbi:protein kinase domain-containing protein [Actinoallomurus acaciae]|uniref:Protein kinase n=1 Tax=Actinoallomurus acaciae TaxID=502577 RepID=A0ABV5YAX0_9ACTN
MELGDPERIGGYRVLERLGHGGMGTVFLAEDESGRKVAVKVINADLADDPSFRARFAREADAARRVRRFCTAGVIDARLDEDPLYVVTEYISGPSLERAVTESGALSGSDLEGLAVGVATALSAIHGAGIMHRDLKPSNVLLSAVGPRVIDFGIARAYDAASEVTRTGQLVGTPAYLAPEALRGEEITPACDVFAWGCVVAYAGTGRSPFVGGNVSEILYRVAHDRPRLDGLDPDLRELVERALDKRPERRPSAGELLTHLVGSEDVERATRLLTPGQEVTGAGRAQAPVVPESSTRVDGTGAAPSSRRRLPIVTGAAVLVAAAVAALLIFLHGGTPAGTLTAGHSLTPNHGIKSPNGAFFLTQQDDGNLVLYDRTRMPVWQSDTDHHPSAVTELQKDGNLVVRDISGTLWRSGTAGTLGARLVVGDDGRLVIRDKDGKTVWTATPNV